MISGDLRISQQNPNSVGLIKQNYCFTSGEDKGGIFLKMVAGGRCSSVEHMPPMEILSLIPDSQKKQKGKTKTND